MRQQRNIKRKGLYSTRRVSFSFRDLRASAEEPVALVLRSQPARLILPSFAMKGVISRRQQVSRILVVKSVGCFGNIYIHHIFD